MSAWRRRLERDQADNTTVTAQESKAGGSAVLALDGASHETETDLWEAVLNGKAITLTSRPKTGTQTSLMSIPASALFTKQVMEVASQAGQTLGASNVFRLELPAGETVASLARAAGGGFRGFTMGSSGIQSHARLVPVSGAPAASLAPLIGVMGVVIVAQMVSQHHQQQILARIQQGVDWLVKDQIQGMVSSLDSAAEALQEAVAGVLDSTALPSTSGFDSNAQTVRQLKFQARRWMDSWAEIGPSFKKGKASYIRVREALDAVAVGGYESFPVQLSIAYRSLQLDSGYAMVSMAEAALSSRRAAAMANFERNVQARFQENGEEMARLRSILHSLADLRLTHGLIPRPLEPNKPAKMQWEIGRLQRALSFSPELPTDVFQDGRVVLNLEQAPDGALMVLVDI